MESLISVEWERAGVVGVAESCCNEGVVIIMVCEVSVIVCQLRKY